MTNRRNERAKKEMQLLRDEFGGICEICGAIDNLEFAHKTDTGLKGMGRGRKERITDIRKNRDKYALTCHEHNRSVKLD